MQFVAYDNLKLVLGGGGGGDSGGGGGGGGGGDSDGDGDSGCGALAAAGVRTPLLLHTFTSNEFKLLGATWRESTRCTALAHRMPVAIWPM